MKIIFIIFCLFFLFSKDLLSEADYNLDYFRDSLEIYKNFSAIITQIQDNGLSQGKISIAKSRVRIDYVDPSEITLVINSKKGMYYNKDLNEVQYFGTKNTEALVFYDLFFNDFFLDDFKITNQQKSLVYKKIQRIVDEEILINVIFEKKPFLLREITLKGNNVNVRIGLADHNFNPIFEKNFFSMADPTIR